MNKETRCGSGDEHACARTTVRSEVARGPGGGNAFSKWVHGEELKMDQQNFPLTPNVPAPFGLQAEVILRLHVLKLDAHLEAAAEKGCSVFWKLTNYPD